MREPGTIPPPRTKSSSRIPVDHRSVAPGCTLERRAGAAARASSRPVRPRAAVADFLDFSSSARVFHSPQAGHCPCHRAVSLPHWVQKKVVVVLGIRRAGPSAQARSAGLNDSKRVLSLRKNKSMVPVGPLRCLLMINSAFPAKPFSCASMSDR
jgi:hypothetical protein